MVDTGIVQKLLGLLDRHVEEGNVTVQHAALSALRNLAIPGELHQSRFKELSHMLQHPHFLLFEQTAAQSVLTVRTEYTVCVHCL